MNAKILFRFRVIDLSVKSGKTSYSTSSAVAAAAAAAVVVTANATVALPSSAASRRVVRSILHACENVHSVRAPLT